MTITAKDKRGRDVILHAGGVLIGDCRVCLRRCVALENTGDMFCTHCSGIVDWLWTNPVLAFRVE